MCCSHKCGALSADSERYRSHVKWLHISCLDWIWNQMHMSCHDNEPGVLSPGPAFEVTESFTQPSDILRHISYSPLFLSLMCVVCVTSVSNLTNENSIRKYLHTKRLKASHIRMQTATYKKNAQNTFLPRSPTSHYYFCIMKLYAAVHSPIWIERTHTFAIVIRSVQQTIEA